MSDTKILIVEDDKASAVLLKQILIRKKYRVDISYNGKEALKAIQKKKYDALLTDWMMPQMDGIELIRRVREFIKPVPVIMMITALSSDDARKFALKSGADDFVVKPYDPIEILKQIEILFSRIKQQVPAKVDIPEIKVPKKAPFIGVCIAVSSGGPQTMKKMLQAIPVIDDAAFFIVQHAPEWVFVDMAKSWNRVCAMDLVLGEEKMKVSPGKIYLAPGDKHMTVTGSLKIHLSDDPPENHVRPAADPLFRSVAKIFGERSIAVVMTGMGCDGTQGASHISAAKGIVIAQDPKTAIVYSMPESVINTVSGTIVSPLPDIPETIAKYVNKLIENVSSSISKTGF